MKEKNKIGLKIFFIFLPLLIIVSWLSSIYPSLAIVAVLALIIASLFFFFILKDPFLGISMIVLTLPFERIPTYDAGFGTLKIDQFFAGLTLVSFLLLILTNKFKFKSFPIGWAITLFLLTSLVSVINAVDIKRAFIVYIFEIFMILIGFAVSQIINSRQRLITITRILFFITFFVCIFGIYQFLGDVAGLPIALTGLKDIYSKSVLGFPRIHAFSMEPLYFANFLFIPLGIALSLFFQKKYEVISQNKLIFLILLIILNIILGISRGAYIALVIMIMFFILFLYRKVITVKNVVITLLVSVIILGSAYAFLSKSRPDALANFISHAKVEDFATGESVQKRLGDYDKAIEFWQQKPIIGIGPGNYGSAYDNYPNTAPPNGWQIVNNEYIEILTETGIIGLLFFTLVILLIFWKSILAYSKTKDLFLKSVLIGLLAAFIAILVQYNFFSTLYIMHIWVLIGLIIAVQNIIFLNKGDR